MSGRPARPPRRRVDGVLLLDKPGGMSSQGAVTRVKVLYNALKAGHTGTLDPMATGLLPVALGEATKFSSVLLDATKTYVATVRLGLTTTTADLEGEVTGTCAIVPERDRVEAALEAFRGEIEQTPPMYSALKHAGRPLYEYARKGTHIERTPRRVTIEALKLRHYSAPDAELEVTCSKGTYVRVLAEDIGKALGCGACLAALRRLRVADIDIGQAITVDRLDALTEQERIARLLPVDAMLAALPAVSVDDERARRLSSGLAVEGLASARHEPVVRVYGPGGRFLGLAEYASSGRLQPRRWIASAGVNLEENRVQPVK